MKEVTITTFDTETTGLPVNFNKPPEFNDTNWPKMLSIGWIQRLYNVTDEGILIPSRALKSGSYMVRTNTDIKIDPAAAKVNGLSHAMVNQYGVESSNVLSAFIDVLRSSTLILAHNSDFDKNVVLQACLDISMNNPGTLEQLNKIKCTANASRDIIMIPKHGTEAVIRHDVNSSPFKRPKLVDLFQHLFGHDLYQTHDVFDDVLVLDACVKKMCDRGYIKIQDGAITFISQIQKA